MYHVYGDSKNLIFTRFQPGIQLSPVIRTADNKSNSLSGQYGDVRITKLWEKLKQAFSVSLSGRPDSGAWLYLNK